MFENKKNLIRALAGHGDGHAQVRPVDTLRNDRAVVNSFGDNHGRGLIENVLLFFAEGADREFHFGTEVAEMTRVGADKEDGLIVIMDMRFTRSAGDTGLESIGVDDGTVIKVSQFFSTDVHEFRVFKLVNG